MTNYRVALIGTGSFAAEHVRAVRAAGDRVTLLAAVNPDQESAEAFCAQHGIPAAYTDTGTMLGSIQPDLVLICTPPYTHLPLSLMCLQAGAHVLCEKPLCGSLAEFDHLQQVQKQTGRWISTISQWRFGSAAQHLKQLIEQGAPGKLLLATCHTLWYRDMAYYGVEWRAQWATAFGGTTTGLGIHLMDLLLWLLPDWVEVRALVDTLDRPIEVDNISLAHVRFTAGGYATIANSAVSPRQETYLRLDFQDATVEAKGLYSVNNEHWTYTPTETDSTLWQIPHNQSGLVDAQLSALLDSLDDGQAPLVTGEEARRILEFLTCLYKSAQTGAPVRRGSITVDDPFYHAMSGQH
jgi:predicted dehydrogenase